MSDSVGLDLELDLMIGQAAIGATPPQGNAHLLTEDLRGLLTEDGQHITMEHGA